MKNQPGISWGVEAEINLIRHLKEWAAFFCYENGEQEIIKIFKPRNCHDYYKMMEQLILWNYGTCKLCPMVRADMDYTS